MKSNTSLKLRLFASLSLCCGLLMGLALFSVQPAFAKKAKAKVKAKKKAAPTKMPRPYTRKGWIYASAKSFPTNASSIRQLRKKAAKLNQKLIQWDGSRELAFNFLLVMRRRARKGTLAIKLLKLGSKKHVDVMEFGKPKKFMLSNLSFSSSEFKTGVIYELRAVVAYKRGKKLVEKKIASTYFRLKN